MRSLGIDVISNVVSAVRMKVVRIMEKKGWKEEEEDRGEGGGGEDLNIVPSDEAATKVKFGKQAQARPLM